MHNLADNIKFFGQFLRNPKMVGSVIPTSRRVISHMLAQVDWARTQVFVEYGPGVGTFTRPILQALPADALLIAIDTNRDFIDHLGDAINDPRLILVHGSAAETKAILARHAGGRQADYVISGLPFSTLPPGVGDSIMAATAHSLKEDGAFLIYQYSRFVVPLLRPYFPAISISKVWRNIPPCMVFVARKQRKS